VIALTVLMGVAPNLFLKPMAASVERTLDLIRRGMRVEARVVTDPMRAEP
jgi:hypothetical protein